MDVPVALLCDFATVREGLLHLLGGGLTRLWRPELPAPLNVTLSLLVELEQDELDVAHELVIDVRGPDDDPVAEARAEFHAPSTDRLEDGEKLTSPVVVPLHAVTTSRFGPHTIKVSIDGVLANVVDFWVLHVDEMMLPSPR